MEWQAIKQRVLAACREAGLEVFGVESRVHTVLPGRTKLSEGAAIKTPKDVMTAFCKAEGVAANIKAVGLDYYNGYWASRA